MVRLRLGSPLLLPLVCGALFVAAAAQVRSPRGSALAVAVESLGSPVLAAVDALALAGHDLATGERDIELTLAELARLREENASLRRSSQLLAAELAALRQGSRTLAAFPELADGAVLARVLARELLTTHTLRLDRGVRDGVRVDAPVLAEGGVVGRVDRVFPGSCRVQLLSHPAAAAAVRIVGFEAEALLLGGERPTLTGLSPYSQVAVDTPIVTTGSEGIYPPGLLVGITGESRTTGLFTVVDVKLAVHPADVLAALVLPTAIEDRP